MAKSVLGDSLIGEYLTLFTVTHAAVCTVVWSVAVFFEPSSVGLAIAWMWTVLRFTEMIGRGLITFLIGIAIAGMVLPFCFREQRLLPPLGLLAAVQPNVCLGMLIVVVVVDVLEWARTRAPR